MLYLQCSSVVAGGLVPHRGRVVAYRGSWRMLGAVMERFLPDGAPAIERMEATLLSGKAPGRAKQPRAVPGVWS